MGSCKCHTGTWPGRFPPEMQVGGYSRVPASLGGGRFVGFWGCLFVLLCLKLGLRKTAWLAPF